MNTMAEWAGGRSKLAIAPLACWVGGLLLALLVWVAPADVPGESGLIALAARWVLAATLLFISGVAGAVIGYVAVRRLGKIPLVLAGLVASLASLAYGGFVLAQQWLRS